MKIQITENEFNIKPVDHEQELANYINSTLTAYLYEHHLKKDGNVVVSADVNYADANVLNFDTTYISIIPVDICGFSNLLYIKYNMLQNNLIKSFIAEALKSKNYVWLNSDGDVFKVLLLNSKKRYKANPGKMLNKIKDIKYIRKNIDDFSIYFNENNMLTGEVVSIVIQYKRQIAIEMNFDFVNRSMTIECFTHPLFVKQVTFNDILQGESEQEYFDLMMKYFETYLTNFIILSNKLLNY